MKLPDKPSELIRVALDDLNKVERRKGYTVDMHVWHRPASDTTCHVCLAGAVMARMKGYEAYLTLSPGRFYDHAVVRKLFALDEFRRGRVNCALASMGISRAGSYADMDVTPYEKDKTQFKRDMRAILHMLEKHGL